MTRASFTRLIPSALIAVFAAIAGIAPAVAQDAPPPAATSTASADTQLETIEVTGSRIRQVDLETAQPVVFITRDDIERQGFQNLADILQNLSSAGNPALSRASPLSAGENVGGSFISLRGVGAARTLVLVNGKRLGISTSGFQDISVIPLAMVERVEVLKDGASAIYGSDAMGGVVNIITRSKFDGLNISATYGVYDEGDGQIDKYDLVIGQTSPKGSLAAGLEYANEARVGAADRDFAAYPQGALHPTRNWTVVGEFGGFVTPVAIGTCVAAGRCLPDPNDPTTNTRLFADYIAQDITTGSAAATREGSTLHKTNTNTVTDLRTPLQRKSVFLAGNYNLADNMQFVADMAYTDREASRQVAGYPYQSLVFNTPMSADSYFNPIGTQSAFGAPQAITNWWRRAWEVPRTSVSELDVLRVTGGVRGDGEMFGRLFNWNSDVMYSSNNVIQSSYGNLNVANVRQSVGPSFLNTAGRVQCGTALAPIDFSNCVPWNPFAWAGNATDGSLTNNPALVNYLMQEEHSTGKTSTRILTTGITGPIVELPAGPLAMAVAIERREEVGEFTPDALAVTAGSTNLAARGTGGGFDASEIYGELDVPLVADVIAVDKLKVNLAMRYSDYNTFGGEKRGKAMLEYRPIDELLVRGTYSEGFRVPTISDLYAGGSQSFSFYTDPCDPVFGAALSDPATAARCDAAISNYPATVGGYTATVPDACGGAGQPSCFRQLGQGFTPAGGPNTQTPVAFFQGAGNPALEPERSYGKTMGIVWTSSLVKDLTLGLDYWTIRINNTIVTDTPSSILTDCYTNNVAARCIGFTRDPTLGYVNTFSFGQRNAGYREHTGYDFDVNYKFRIGPWTELGNYVFNWQTTYLDKQVFKSTNSAATPESNEIAFAASAGAVYRTRSNMNINWQLANLGATLGARYYSRVRETCLSATLFPGECSGGAPASGGNNLNDVGDNTFFDAQFRYTTPWQGVMSVGANNIFEHIGPQMYSQPDSNVSYNGEFDIGRFWYAKYTHKF
jgi:iron complex outermembrane receptor protein